MNPYDYTSIQDLQEYMRLMSLGQQGQMQQPGMNPSSVQPYDVTQRLQQLYQPESSAQNRYNQLLQQFPQREKPGKLRQIGAALAGLSAVGPGNYTESGQAVGFRSDPIKQMQVQDQFLNRPYYQKMDDFTARLKPTAEAADIEARSNTGKRQFAENIISQERQRDELERREARDRQLANKEKVEAERKRLHDENELKIRQQRADVYQFKAMHPDWKPFVEKGGNLWFVNPQNPDMKVDTGIDSGTLSDMEKVTFGLTSALQQIDARGEESRKTEEVKAGNRQEDIAARGTQARTTKATPTAPRAPVAPTQEDTTIRDAKGNVVQTREINKNIPANQARVKVKGPKGESGTVPLDSVNKLPKGWEVVK